MEDLIKKLKIEIAKEQTAYKKNIKHNSKNTAEYHEIRLGALGDVLIWIDTYCDPN